MSQCVICGLEGCTETQLARDAVKIECVQCGAYEITGSLLATFKYDKEHKLPHTASAWIREYNVDNGKPPLLMSDDLEMLQTIPDKPLMSKFERFMEKVQQSFERVTGNVVINLNNDTSWLSITWVKNELEFKSLIEEGFERGYIVGEIPKMSIYEGELIYKWRAIITKITFRGREYVQELGRTGGNSNKVFMAFHFTDEMKESFEVTTKRAVTDASNGKLEAVRVGTSSTPTDTKIDDALIGMLKSSKVVIADFTGQRQAVYYEAGYAMGMGIPVIWTCRADEVDKLSFDTRQYPHILWEDEKDLYKQLTARLSAQII